MTRKEALLAIEKEILSANLSLKENGLLVFGKGNPEAEILFIGEAPGAKEAEAGLPFVGSAGKRLDKLLHTINLSIEDIYIANILKYRPPKNRDPTRDEIIEHTPYLIKQIDVINPKVIIPLGNYATKFVLSGFSPNGMNKIEGISELHGKSVTMIINLKEYTIIPMYHPAAMMYNPRLIPEVEKDYVKMKKILKR